jgi:hypothetical protein
MPDDLKGLPQSEELDISALCRLFEDTTNSYKYVLFLSLLDILKRRLFDVSLPIDIRKITIEMLANTWYPHTYFKLSFGLQDKITEKLDSLQLEISEPILKFTDTDKNCLRETIGNQNLDFLLVRYVPFRLLRPFFKQELHGLKDHVINQRIEFLSKEHFQTRKPLFCFERNCEAIIVHPEWASYIKTNYPIIRAWASWEWLEYMQRCNSNVTAVVNKLFPPQHREPLTAQKSYWKIVLEHTDVRCIYSGETLKPDNISLDHYLPWSFVAHNQLWNLIPTIPAINSAKSNNLPSGKYFNEFVKTQYLGLTISRKQVTTHKWNKYIESYISDLKINNKNDLLNFKLFRGAYKATLAPLTSLAASQGFMADWSYK